MSFGKFSPQVPEPAGRGLQGTFLARLSRTLPDSARETAFEEMTIEATFEKASLPPTGLLARFMVAENNQPTL